MLDLPSLPVFRQYCACLRRLKVGDQVEYYVEFGDMEVIWSNRPQPNWGIADVIAVYTSWKSSLEFEYSNNHLIVEYIPYMYIASKTDDLMLLADFSSKTQTLIRDVLRDRLNKYLSFKVISNTILIKSIFKKL